MPQLKAMASKSLEIPESHPNLRQKTQTPLQVAAWEAALRSHPNTEFADYIREGIQWGFRTDYDYTCSPAHSNLPSAREHPEVITKYLSNKTAKGRILGPFPISSILNIQISRIGVIPKKSNPDIWRLITIDTSWAYTGMVKRMWMQHYLLVFVVPLSQFTALAMGCATSLPIT